MMCKELGCARKWTNFQREVNPGTKLVMIIAIISMVVATMELFCEAVRFGVSACPGSEAGIADAFVCAGSLLSVDPLPGSWEAIFKKM